MARWTLGSGAWATNLQHLDAAGELVQCVILRPVLRRRSRSRRSGAVPARRGSSSLSSRGPVPAVRPVARWCVRSRCPAVCVPSPRVLLMPALEACRRRRRPQWPADGVTRPQPPGGLRLCEIASIDALPQVAAAASHHQRSTRRLFLSFARTCALAGRYCLADGFHMLSGWVVDLERPRRDLARLIRRCERRRAMAISRLRGKAIPSSAASTASTVPPRICGPDVSAACCRPGAAGWAFDASAPAPVMIPSRCARSTRAWLRPPWSRRRPRGVGSGEDGASGAHPLCALPVPAVGVCRPRRRPRWPADGAIRSSHLAACDCQMHQLMQLPRVAAAASHHQRSVSTSLDK